MISLLLLFITHQTTQAQGKCNFTFKGQVKFHDMTICFYKDKNDSNVSGEIDSEGLFYYFKGKATYDSHIKGYRHKFQILDKRTRKVVGKMEGNLKKGIMQGSFEIYNSNIDDPYHLELVR